MASGRGVSSRIFRWRSIRAYQHGAGNPNDVVNEVARLLDDKNRVFIQVETCDARLVAVEYGPSFDDETRKIIHDALVNKFPAARLGFYGEEAVVTLRGVVCLGDHVQGTLP